MRVRCPALFVFMVAVFLVALTCFAQPAVAQNAAAAAGDPPLNFGNNFFVTGDYVVAGAQNLNMSFGNDGFGTGIISFPDANPGIRGTTTVPKGANIVAALLYWQTVEKVGAPGSGQNGFFGPVFNKVPQLYAISGESLPNHNATSFSNGGCSGASTGKLVQTYRADVRGFLPLDANGNVLVDSPAVDPVNGVTFEVRLPNVGNNTPLTLGASLLIVYRVISPNFPLNVITIYDGGFAANSAPNFTMSLLAQGLVQAGLNGPAGQILPPVSKLTHIVGAGKSNKFQAAFLGGGQGANNQRPPTQLPSPYGDGQPAFPGFYTNWDNTTWVFPDPTFPGHPNLANPLQGNDDSATAMVVASGATPGCVSWGATIVSTTIRDDDKDGIPPVWKTNKRYTDPATGQIVSLDDPLDEPKAGHQDIFIQMDHVVDANGDFSIPAAPAVNMVKSAFLSHNIHLHITDASVTTGIANANIVHEPACADKPLNSPPFYCPYLNQPGVTSWRYGFEFVKNQPLNYPDESSCEAALNGPCVRRFPIAQRNSHHYVVIGDTLGAANWTFFAGKLTDNTGTTVPGTGIVSQTNDVHNTVTFQTTYGHGLTVDATHTMPNGRVTISNAITNPNLNGTFFVTSVTCPTNPDTHVPNDCAFTNKASGPYTFQIQIPGNRTTANYTVSTDPYLAVFSGQATSGSGLSDVGGAGTLITLGKWGANATLSAYAGTLMHELGHTLGLSLHGGSYYDGLPQDPNDYRPNIEANCKSNYQSVMNYMFQARLLGASVYSISQTSLASTVATYSFTLVSGSLPQVGQTVNVTGTTNGGGIFNVPNANVPNPVITSVNLLTNTFTVSIPKPDVGPGAENASIANATMVSTVDFSRQQLSTLDETHLLSSPITTTDPQIAFHTTDWYDKQTFVFVLQNGNLVKVPLGTAATHHCGDTPLNTNDVINPMYFYSGGTSPLNSIGITIPWSSNTLDANFDGTSPGAAGSEPPKFRGYNDLANLDPRQTGGTGSSLLGPGGLLNGGAGGLFGGPGGLFGGPGGLFGGPGGLFGGPGGLFGGPGGLFGGPGGLFGGPGELDFANAISVTPPPTQLSASEGVSPRTITLTWTEPNFPATDHNNIYRDSHDGNGFVFLASVGGTAPGTQNTFTDTVTCNPNGYSYFVTTVFIDTTANPPQPRESTQSNTVSTGQNGGLLTGCYAPVGFSLSSPAKAVQGSIVSVTFTVLDDFNAANSPVNTVDNRALVTLVANGPLPGNCGTVGPTTLLNNGQLTAQSGAASTFPASSGGHYTFNWDTDGFCAGQYTFTLTLDSSQTQTTRTPLQLQVDVTDTDSTNPHITTTAIANGVVGTSYSQLIKEDGGVSTPGKPFTWIVLSSSFAGFTSTIPLPGLSLGTAADTVSGLLSGIPSAAGMFSFTVQVTDSVGNIGTQTLTMTVTTPVAQINQPLAPDSSVPGAAACTPTCTLTLNGTGFGPGSVVMWNGSPLVTTFISNKQLTAAIPAADLAALGTASVSVSNPVTVGNKAVPKSNIDFFQITPTTSASLSRTDSNTGTGPLGLIAADFNGDGKLDLAIANSADNTISILLGNGDGTFTAQPALSTGVGSNPQLPIAGDFNGDGKLDLAVANFGNGTVSVFLGNGDGTFQTPAAAYAVGTGPGSLVTGDFNRDGALDLAVANQSNATVSILLGNGDGTFQAHVDYAAVPPTLNPKDVGGIASGDFNRDSELDLVVTNPSNNTVSVLLGNGDGTFQAPVAYATGKHPINLGVADLNGDGSLDLAVANMNDNTVSILLGNGTGTFTVKGSYPTTAGPATGPTAVATGDFNGDGKVDLAITNTGDNSVSILLGNGDGTFQAQHEFTTGTTAAGIAAGDFNGDGRLDVAVANFGSNTVSVMLQRPEPATALAVSNVTASQVGLTWTASVSTTVVGYNVYRGTTTGGPYTKVNLAPVAAPMFTDMSVASGTTYFYVVTAVDPGNLESVKSNEVSATTPPLPPTNPMTSNVTASQVPLSWTASTTASVVSYNVYRSTTSGSGYAKVGSVNAPTTSFTDMTVASGTPYFYVVTAVGPANAESVKSTEVSATTPPQPATALTAAVQGTAPSESVQLNWTASTTPTVVGYNIYRGTTSGGPYPTKVNAAIVAASPFTDTSVVSGTTYFYVVTAVGPGGVESVFSNEASAVVP